jgi:hypothetical protein
VRSPRHPAQWLLAFVVLVGLAALSPRMIPYNMDEFAHYHALGCWAFPLNHAHNTFRESCAAQELRPPFIESFLPLRSYAYIGSLPVIPFLPFWAILSDPFAVRIQGIIFFIASTLLLARLIAVDVSVVLLASLLFPLNVFLYVVDTGPSALPSIFCLLILVLIQAWARESAPGRRVALAACAGLIIFLGFFVKPIFLLFVPALGLFAWVTLKRSGLVAWASSLLVGSLAFLLPALVLLLSTDRRGVPYYELIRVGGISLRWRSMADVGALMGGYFLCASSIVPRTLEFPRLAVDSLPALASVALVGTALISKGRRSAALWLLMVLVTFGATLLVGAASEPHHFAFTMLFLTGLLGIALDEARRLEKRLLPGVAILVLLYWGGLALRWPSVSVSPDTGSEKDQLLAFVRGSGLDKKTVQVHASWGTYYIAHLFGDKEQEVLFVDSPEAAPGVPRRLRELAGSQGRGILLISSRWPELKNAPTLRESWGAPRAIYSFGPWAAVEY